MFSQYSQGLVGHWSFDNCLPNDSSTSQANGTVNSGIQCIPGVRGQAFKFNGINDFIDIGNKDLFKKGDDITITAWIKIEPNSGDDGFSAIITKWENGGGPQEWWFGVYKTELHFTTEGYPCATLCPDRMSNGIKLYDNCWTFVGIVLTGNNRIQYIKNGRIIDEDSNDYSFTPQPTNIRIGRQNPNNRPAARFKGGIDEVRIYNRALSPDEIDSLYKKDYQNLRFTRYNEVHICKGDSIILNGLVNYSAQYKWTPSSKLSCLTCSKPIANPDTTSIFYCEAIANDECESTLTQVKVVVDSIPKPPLDFKLSKDISIFPDSRFDMCITTSNILSPFNITDFSAQISFNSNWMFIDSTIGLNTVKLGNVFDNSWVITKQIYTKDTNTIISIVGNGKTPIGTGDSILTIAFRSYLSDVLAYEPMLTMKIKTSMGCFSPTISNGLVSLQSCFKAGRRIKLSGLGYSLSSIFEQQTSNLVTILYSIGLKAKTKLELYDSAGRLFRQLIDDSQDSGEYRISLPPDLPSGIYFCRMNSGSYDNSIKFAITQ